jgi:hypothetical protein
MEAYKLSIVIFSDEADPADLLQAIQDAGESIASDYDGDCPEMDGANGMVQCLDETPTSNTITLGSTKLERLQRERSELLSACYTLQREREELLAALEALTAAASEQLQQGPDHDGLTNCDLLAKSRATLRTMAKGGA